MCPGVVHSSEVATNCLDPYHSVYILADDGTAGNYHAEPAIRGKLENFIATETTLNTLGDESKNIFMLFPTLTVVIGGSLNMTLIPDTFRHTCTYYS